MSGLPGSTIDSTIKYMYDKIKSAGDKGNYTSYVQYTQSGD